MTTPDTPLLTRSTHWLSSRHTTHDKRQVGVDPFAHFAAHKLRYGFIKLGKTDCCIGLSESYRDFMRSPSAPRGGADRELLAPFVDPRSGTAYNGKYYYNNFEVGSHLATAVACVTDKDLVGRLGHPCESPNHRRRRLCPVRQPTNIVCPARHPTTSRSSTCGPSAAARTGTSS